MNLTSNHNPVNPVVWLMTISIPFGMGIDADGLWTGEKKLVLNISLACGT